MDGNTLPSTPSPTRFRVAVDTVIFTLYQRDLKVCLIHEQQRWGLPGTALQPNEGLDDAAQRQLALTLGIADLDPYLQQLYSFGATDQHTVSVVYFALVSGDKLMRDSHTHEQLTGKSPHTHWHSVYQLPMLNGNDANVIQYALTRLRYKIEYSAVAFELLPDAFTLRELQFAYMIILNDYKLDKANFRKKIREANILEAVQGYRSTGGRPAKLFRFRDDAQLETKARRFFP